MLVSFAAQKMRGNSPYLTQTGPPPLRFALTMANWAPFTLPPSLSEHHAATNATEIATNKVDVSETNAFAFYRPSLPVVTNTPNVSTTITATAESPNEPALTPSASDMLVVSPQMLTEYFKPGPDGTNSGSGSGLILPVAVGFTPPSAKPSSQATYKVQ
jgi:hypothetical protein